ncbi:MAG: HAD family hydrolase [Gammaproteobacteria bacterium]|nr:HAD family hydrolase [Gammaproteobacteria bacterium]
MANKTLVFDFDGTLIDSAPGILNAFADALRETGISSRVALDSRLIGPPLKETLMRLSSSDDPALIQSLSEHFKLHYDSTGVATTDAYPGIEEMLDAFAATGTVMHISTNKRLSVTHAILARLGWQDRFTSVYALDMVEPRLPSKAHLLSKQISEQRLDPSITVYIGDKFEDGEAAKANGLAFHYASWGYGDLQRAQLDDDWNWLSHPADLCKSSRP